MFGSSCQYFFLAWITPSYYSTKQTSDIWIDLRRPCSRSASPDMGLWYSFHSHGTNVCMLRIWTCALCIMWLTSSMFSISRCWILMSSQTWSLSGIQIILHILLAGDMLLSLAIISMSSWWSERFFPLIPPPESHRYKTGRKRGSCVKS